MQTVASTDRSYFTGSHTTSVSAAAPQRPKSAGAVIRKHPVTNHPQSAPSATSPSARVLNATRSSSRVGGHPHVDHFCKKIESLRHIGPRRPSAASSTIFTSSIARATRFQKPEEPYSSTNVSVHAVGVDTTRTSGIAQRVVQEEIETQRCATRQAQRQVHALQQSLAQKTNEIELLRRQSDTFTARTAAMVASTPAASLSLPHSHLDRSVAVESHSTTSAAGAPAVSTTTAQSTDARLKDHVQRQELYKKKLRYFLDRLCRHVQFMDANVEALRRKHDSSKRERSFFEAKVVHARHQCADLEHALQELAAQQTTHTKNATLVLNSLRDEIASRSLMSRQRREADRRRDELLALVQTTAVDRSAIGVDNRDSTDKRGSEAVSQRSPRHRSSSVYLQQQFLRRESSMQLVESEYARVLTATNESDLSVALERFASYRATKRQLQQAERDALAQQQQLERKHNADHALVQKLRVSGIASVEKRTRIRDAFDQLRDSKAQAKADARDKCVDVLKTFSYVQQGISNIVELCKCLDSRVPQLPAPTRTTLTSPLASTSSPASVVCSLTAIVRFCIQVVRKHAIVSPNDSKLPIEFSDKQVEALRAVVLGSPRAARTDKLLSPSSPTRVRSDPLEPASPSAKAAAAAVSASAQRIVSSLLSSTRRQSSTASALGWESTLRPAQSGVDLRSASIDDDDSERDALDDVQCSSDSDTDNDVRRDIKRNARATLEQVDALLTTLEHAHQHIQQQPQTATKGHSTALTRYHYSRATAQHRTLHSVSTLASSVESLDAVHAFFREKRRRKRHEQQQQQQQQLAQRTDVASTTYSNHRIGHTSSTEGANAISRASLASIMAPHKRSNGSVLHAVHTSTQAARQQQQHFPLSSSQSTSSSTHKPHRPKTAR